MIHWIESQSTTVIAVVLLGICYAVAAATFGVTMILSRRPIGQQLQAVSPVTLTPLAVILGLLIAFLAARVWENVGHGNEYVSQEASALSKVLLLAKAFPTDVQAKIREAVAQHVDFVVTQDWPQMALGHADQRAEPVGLTNAMAALLSFTPANADQTLAQQRAVAALEQAFEARRNRIRLSQAEIAPTQWAVIIILALLILLTIAAIHIGKPAAMFTTLFIFATAVAVCMILLMENDRPFAAGGITFTPAAFRDIVLY
jgi:hypothetical protein